MRSPTAPSRLSGLAIDPAALVIESTDIDREARLKAAIGSTGTGGGSALARRIEQKGALPRAYAWRRTYLTCSPYIREAGRVLEEARAREVGYSLKAPKAPV